MVIPMRMLLTALLLTAFTTAQAADVAVSGAWVAEAPPTAKVFAAYAELKNNGSDPIEILGAKSHYFGAIEMHETVTRDNGSTGMMRLGKLQLAPGETLSFVPGGKHFMLFRPAQPVRAGESLFMRLHFSDGDSKIVELPVKRR